MTQNKINYKIDLNLIPTMKPDITEDTRNRLL